MVMPPGSGRGLVAARALLALMRWGLWVTRPRIQGGRTITTHERWPAPRSATAPWLCIWGAPRQAFVGGCRQAAVEDMEEGEIAVPAGSGGGARAWGPRERAATSLNLALYEALSGDGAAALAAAEAALDIASAAGCDSVRLLASHALQLGAGRSGQAAQRSGGPHDSGGRCESSKLRAGASRVELCQPS